jgi:hypothetical protein
MSRVGYWIRPYDMLADRRRWRWQKARRCGPPMGTTPEMMAELTAAVGRYHAQQERARLDQGCTVPPFGWWCSRTPGHDGPCAARPIGSHPPVSSGHARDGEQ